MDNELLYQAILIVLSSHRGRFNRIGKWRLVETVFMLHIPQAKRNANNPFERKMREAISHMRHNGVLIGSDTRGGYWLMEELDEVLAVAGQFRQRAKDLLHSASKLESTGRSVFGGQRRLF